MKSVIGLFENHSGVECAVGGLRKLGVADDAIHIIAPDHDRSQEVGGAPKGTAEQMAAGGAAAGGIAGLVAGLTALAIPGVGPIVASGALATGLMTALGVAGGGALGAVVGALSERGVPGLEAETYAEGIRRGGTLVIADVHEDLAAAAATLMREAGAADIERRDSSGGGSAVIGDVEMGGTTRRYVSADDPAGRDRSEPSARNNWGADERVEGAAPHGAGNAAGGVMGSTLGGGTTVAAGGAMGISPAAIPSDPEPTDLPNPERQADIERQRRDQDPAP